MRTDPTIGRKVWYYADKDSDSGMVSMDSNQPFDGTVIYVWPNGPLVNVRVTDHVGMVQPRHSIPLIQEDDPIPQGPYVKWMPYQVKQAASANLTPTPSPDSSAASVASTPSVSLPVDATAPAAAPSDPTPVAAGDSTAPTVPSSTLPDGVTSIPTTDTPTTTASTATPDLSAAAPSVTPTTDGTSSPTPVNTDPTASTVNSPVAAADVGNVSSDPVTAASPSDSSTQTSSSASTQSAIPTTSVATGSNSSQSAAINGSFGSAISAAQGGQKVKRASWPSSVFVYYVPAASYPASTDIAKETFGEDAKVPYMAYLAIKRADNQVCVFAPGIDSILASDWQIAQ